MKHGKGKGGPKGDLVKTDLATSANRRPDQFGQFPGMSVDKDSSVTLCAKSTDLLIFPA